jgi:HD superfamily phosphodiesterase
VRVHEYGLRLADKTGANTVVVELIAFIHDIDICRRNDAANLDHGQRAAESASELPYVRALQLTKDVLRSLSMEQSFEPGQ